MAMKVKGIKEGLIKDVKRWKTMKSKDKEDGGRILNDKKD